MRAYSIKFCARGLIVICTSGLILIHSSTNTRAYANADAGFIICSAAIIIHTTAGLFFLGMPTRHASRHDSSDV